MIGTTGKRTFWVCWEQAPQSNGQPCSTLFKTLSGFTWAFLIDAGLFVPFGVGRDAHVLSPVARAALAHPHFPVAARHHLRGDPVLADATEAGRFVDQSLGGRGGRLHRLPQKLDEWDGSSAATRALARCRDTRCSTSDNLRLPASRAGAPAARRCGRSRNFPDGDVGQLDARVGFADVVDVEAAPPRFAGLGVFPVEKIVDPAEVVGQIGEVRVALSSDRAATATTLLARGGQRLAAGAVVAGDREQGHPVAHAEALRESAAAARARRRCPP